MDFIKQNWIAITVVAVVVFVLWSTLGRRKDNAADRININAKCLKCRWQGTVSKYNVVCRKCGNKDMKIL